MSGGASRDLDVSPDAMRWSEEPPPPRPYISSRDGRFNYAFEAIDHIEDTSCSRGCRWGAAPGSAEEREFGPGGTCHILARVSLGGGEEIPELDDQGEQVVCLVRELASPVSSEVAKKPRLGPVVPQVDGQLGMFDDPA